MGDKRVQILAVSLFAATLADAQLPSVPAAAPQPTDVRALISDDYLDQYLLHQARVLRAMPAPPGPARGAAAPAAPVARVPSPEPKPVLPGEIEGDGFSVLDAELTPVPRATRTAAVPPTPAPAPRPVAPTRATWLKRIPGHESRPALDRSYIEIPCLKACGADYAARARAAIARLASADDRARADANITALAARLAALPDDASIAAAKAAYLELRWAIRPLVFQHPAFDVNELLFYTRRDGQVFPDVSSIHLPWVGSPGGDIHVLEVDRSGATFGRLRPLLRGRLDPGHVRGLDLRFDARRIVFGWTHGALDFSGGPCRPGHDAFGRMGSGWIYELDMAGGEPRQITRGAAVHDAAPAYLPDGRIAFMSNRCRSSVQCNQGQHEMFANLYACEPDGSHLERLNNNANGDYNPCLLPDGRIGYLRWEYNERSFNNNHAFWAVRPDGAYAEPVFGQHVGDPIMFASPRGIPGSRRMMFVVSQHYNFERGILAVFDPDRGFRDLAAARPLLPWTQFKRNTGHPTRDEQGWFAEPWPLAEDLALCAYDFSPNQYQAAGFGLYLVDGAGNQELLYRDPAFSAHQPIPLRARPRPPQLSRMCARPPAASPDLSPVGWRNVAGDGTCILSDVRDGLDGLQTGEPRWLRISENLVLPYFTATGQTMFHDPISWTPKRIVGDVPLESDGSAHFRVPADRALYFQLLDAQGREIRRMRSWVSLQPGERRSCSGCHEGRATAPRLQASPMAARQPATEPLRRVSWGGRPASFHRDVRPILDRHCVACHRGLAPAKALDLTAPHAARRLAELSAPSGRGADHVISQVRQFGTGSAPLLAILGAGKHAEAVKLSEQEWTDLMAWMDLSGVLFDRCQPPYRYTPEGDVAETRPSAPPVSPRLDPAVVTPLFARRCVECHAKADLVFRPHWIDLNDPAKSLFLTAPLAKAAGGSGRCGEVFASAEDPDYQKLLTTLRAHAADCWRNPDLALLPLVEAGRTPKWVAATAP
jgi:hypothetical protein